MQETWCQNIRQAQEKKERMAVEQSMMQATLQAAIEATKATLITVREADKPFNNVSPIHKTPRLGSPVLRQPMFDWKATHKYQELCNFKIEVKNIL